MGNGTECACVAEKEHCFKMELNVRGKDDYYSIVTNETYSGVPCAPLWYQFINALPQVMPSEV